MLVCWCDDNNNNKTVYYKVVRWLNTVANNRHTWATVLINYNPLFTLNWMLTYNLLRSLVIYGIGDFSYLSVLVWTGLRLNFVLFWWPLVLIFSKGNLSIGQNQFAYFGVLNVFLQIFDTNGLFWLLVSLFLIRLMHCHNFCQAQFQLASSA